VNFGVLSISQPEEGDCQRESPAFVGFYGLFLEMPEIGPGGLIYM
jgi:hypothetical protein